MAHHSALSATIKPHHSAFFAGEVFACDITFANTAEPSNYASSSSSVVKESLRSHQKSHSVSIDGRMWSEGAALRNGSALPMQRRRLIGKSEPSSSSFMHPWAMPSSASSSTTATTTPSSSRRHGKSASMIVGKPKTTIGLGHPSSASHNGSPTPPSRVSSLTMPGSTRVPSAPISASHPHSRKKSMAQIQAQDLTEAFELDQPDTSSHSSRTPSAPTTPGTTNMPNEFYKQGRNDTMDSVFRDSLNDGQGLASPIYPSTADTLAVGSEKVLWSFVQIGGTVEVDESLVKPGDFENLKRRLAYGEGGGTIATASHGGGGGGMSRTVGGGDLGHNDLQPRSDSGTSGWTSYLRSPFGGANSNPTKGTTTGPPIGNRHSRTASTLQDTQERTLQSRAVPTFATLPSILAVDLTLAPGESRTYTFQIPLPIDLPPSYHGTSIRFKYTLTLGTNRVETAERGASARTQQKSRLIQIPIRVYNHVGAAGFRPFYDLMNPVILTRDQATVSVQQRQTVPTTVTTQRAKTDSMQNMGRTELQAYAKQLLSLSAPPQGMDESASGMTASGSQPSLEEGGTCKAVVEVLARTSTKVSYDISKDGKVAAVLTLIKSKHRLGDTVAGVISINARACAARIARFSATLETYEDVQPSIATLPAARMSRATKSVYAQHHESVLDKGRASFSLPIPSGASPEFVTSGVKLNWLVRLAFLTISSSTPSEMPALRLPPPPHLLPAPTDGYSRYHISLTAISSLASAQSLASSEQKPDLRFAPETKLETVECAVPITVLPNTTGFKVKDAHFFA